MIHKSYRRLLGEMNRPNQTLHVSMGSPPQLKPNGYGRASARFLSPKLVHLVCRYPSSELTSHPHVSPPHTQTNWAWQEQQSHNNPHNQFAKLVLHLTKQLRMGIFETPVNPKTTIWNAMEFDNIPYTQYGPYVLNKRLTEAVRGTCNPYPLR